MNNHRNNHRNNHNNGNNVNNQNGGKALMIVMTVYDGSRDDDYILKQQKLNFLDPGARGIIARTAWWAMHSGHELITRPVGKGEVVEMIDSREDT